LSIGREGPLIEVGGALGAVVGRIVKTPLNETRVLIGAGTVAGFAAAYNTPFAASLFVLETMAGVAAPELLLPVMAATVGAAGITRATVGPGASRAAAVARHPGRVARRSDRHLAACRRGERVRTAESHCGFRGSR
jgi:CIC family chloride channel protein